MVLNEKYMTVDKITQKVIYSYLQISNKIEYRKLFLAKSNPEIGAYYKATSQLLELGKLDKVQQQTFDHLQELLELLYPRDDDFCILSESKKRFINDHYKELLEIMYTNIPIDAVLKSHSYEQKVRNINMYFLELTKRGQVFETIYPEHLIY